MVYPRQICRDVADQWDVCLTHKTKLQGGYRYSMFGVSGIPIHYHPHDNHCPWESSNLCLSCMWMQHRWWGMVLNKWLWDMSYLKIIGMLTVSTPECWQVQKYTAIDLKFTYTCVPNPTNSIFRAWLNAIHFSLIQCTQCSNVKPSGFHFLQTQCTFS